MGTCSVDRCQLRAQLPPGLFDRPLLGLHKVVASCSSIQLLPDGFKHIQQERLHGLDRPVALVLRLFLKLARQPLQPRRVFLQGLLPSLTSLCLHGLLAGMVAVFFIPCRLLSGNSPPTQASHTLCWSFGILPAAAWCSLTLDPTTARTSPCPKFQSSAANEQCPGRFGRPHCQRCQTVICTLEPHH